MVHQHHLIHWILNHWISMAGVAVAHSISLTWYLLVFWTSLLELRPNVAEMETLLLDILTTDGGCSGYSSLSGVVGISGWGLGYSIWGFCSVMSWTSSGTDSEIIGSGKFSSSVVLISLAHCMDLEADLLLEAALALEVVLVLAGDFVLEASKMYLSLLYDFITSVCL